jgi:hypothetical protein
MLTLAVGAYLTGFFIDYGISARVVAITTGLIMLAPAGLWAWAMRWWKPTPVIATVEVAE